MAKSVFYSFHYTRDVHRVQLVQNIGALEGQPLLNAQEWEKVREQGKAAIQKWIDSQMKYKKAVIVLVGKETWNREWVQYEIQKAWDECKPLLGIRIHGLSSLGNGADTEGKNPFMHLPRVPIFDPTVADLTGKTDTKATYNRLKDNLELWSTQGMTRI